MVKKSARRQDRAASLGAGFFKQRAHQSGIAERKAMIDRQHALPVTHQAKLLKVSRGSLSSTLPARKWLISLETGVQSQTTKRV